MNIFLALLHKRHGEDSLTFVATVQEIKDILASVLFYPLGWIGMFYKYPNATQRRLALAEQHSGSYYHAGKAQAGKLIGMLWKVVLVYFFVTLAFRVLKLFVK